MPISQSFSLNRTISLLKKPTDKHDNLNRSNSGCWPFRENKKIIITKDKPRSKHEIYQPTPPTFVAEPKILSRTTLISWSAFILVHHLLFSSPQVYRAGSPRFPAVQIHTHAPHVLGTLWTQPRARRNDYSALYNHF